jgi:transcriptional regulator with XRE-family HTH domain
MMMTGQELRELRSDAGMTQRQVAELVGYTTKGEPNKSMIARFENGHAKINPRVEAALRFALKSK